MDKATQTTEEVRNTVSNEHSTDARQTGPEVREEHLSLVTFVASFSTILTLLQIQNLPFIAFLMLRVGLTYSYDVMAVILLDIESIGLLCMNAKFVQLVLVRNSITCKQLILNVSWIFVLSIVNLTCIHMFLDTRNLLRSSLFFTLNGSQADELTDVKMFLWILFIADHVVKYTGMVIKCLIIVVPKFILPHQLKGSLYSFIERSLFFYRSLIRVLPWYHFLLGCSSGVVLSSLLIFAYASVKTCHLFKQLRPLLISFLRVLIPPTCGTKPTPAEILALERICPVCHEDCRNPIILDCKHMFCEDCILPWIDKANTCPSCRAPIVEGDLCYRNGACIILIPIF